MAKRTKWYYAKIKFKEFYDGRKIWYLNNYYICDCVNTCFETREDVEEHVEDLKKRNFYPWNMIDEISIHYTLD